jgi:adenylate cyclase
VRSSTHATASSLRDPSGTRALARGLAAGLLAVALVWLLSLSRVWDVAEAKVFDLYTVLAAPYASRLPIVIVAIDEPSFQELQLQWPFPRSLHGRLIERLKADGAAAVGFDVLFAEPSADAEDAALARAIGDYRRVVLAASQDLVDNANAKLWTSVQPLPLLLAAGATTGDIGVQPDDDYVVRRQPVGEDTFSAALARYAPVQANVRAHANELIEYLGPRGTVDTRSYYQAVIPGLLPPGFFKDKIVLVGHSTRSAVELGAAGGDNFNSPFASVAQGDRLFPGVEIQATLLANRLGGAGLARASPALPVALVLVLGVFIAWLTTRIHPGVATAAAAGCVMAVVALSWLLFTAGKLWLPPLFPAAALLAVYLATALLVYLATRRHAMRVRGMFSQYVAPEVVDQLIERPELMQLGGEAREVTLMFTDLANFTTLSEQLSAEQAVEVLTAYFNAMTAIIHRHRGTVDKFIGDAIMAFWGAPLPDEHHAEHAVRAAIDMQAAMQPLVADLRSRGLPAIGMRIGLHTGRAVVGNVGSQTRFSYTAIGDTVNLAARLEGANKAFGTSILISAGTAAQLPEDIQLRALDDVIVKGKSEPVRVFTPCANAQLCQLSRAALSDFQAGRRDAATMQLRAMLAIVPDDPAALQLLARIEQARLSEADAGAPALALDKL